MIRRALGVAAVAVALAACAPGPGTTSPTTIPPTTRAPAPIAPTGVADTVRNWVALLDAGSDDQAWAILGPQSQALIGGRARYRLARPSLKRTWGPFATVPATYDALPIDDAQGLVVVHSPNRDGSERGAAVPMVKDGARWRAEPLLDTGTYRPLPADRTTIAPLPDLRVVVQEGTTVRAWVDGQPASVKAPTAEAGGERSFAYQPSVGLVPGWHLVTLLFERAGAVAARTVRYGVARPK